jgi:hypothetical protein
MCGLTNETTLAHKESTTHRISQDEEDVNRIVKTVSDKMVNSFYLEPETDTDNKQPLVNITTSSVASTEITKGLCSIKEEGLKKVEQFVTQRISSNEVDFFSPILKTKLPRFASLNKMIGQNKDQKIAVANTDRQIFSKPVVIAQARDVDIRDLLKYELAPVPLSLFNMDGSTLALM